jgi:beta-carotene 3-hydroxylase
VTVLLAVAAFVVMEPIAALLHRGLMHRRGWAWHRSHHRVARPGMESNDLFPVVIALCTIVTMAVASTVHALRPLLWLGVGVSAYGAAYLVVHDLLVHQRMGALPLSRTRYISWVAAAHALHHERGGAPYGFLVPVCRATGVNPSGRGLLRPINTRAAARTFSVVGTRARTVNTS